MVLGGQRRVLTHDPIAGQLYLECEGDPLQFVVYIAVCLYGVARAVEIDDPAGASRNGTSVNNRKATIRVIICPCFSLSLQGIEPLVFRREGFSRYSFQRDDEIASTALYPASSVCEVGFDGL